MSRSRVPRAPMGSDDQPRDTARFEPPSVRLLLRRSWRVGYDGRVLGPHWSRDSDYHLDVLREFHNDHDADLVVASHLHNDAFGRGAGGSGLPRILGQLLG